MENREAVIFVFASLYSVTNLHLGIRFKISLTLTDDSI